MTEFKLTRIILLAWSLTFIMACKSSTDKVVQPAPKPKPAKVVKTTKPSLLYEVRPPVKPTKNPPVLYLLHGLGSNKDDLFSFANSLPGELLVICPQAPNRISEKGYSWYPLRRDENGFYYEFKNVQAAVNGFRDFVKECNNKYQVDTDKVLIGGFSQGAITTLSTTLLYPDEIDGLLCLSGALYPELKTMTNKAPSPAPQIFISHGKMDKMLPYADMASASKFLKEKGFTHEFKSYESAHTISQENFQDMYNWLAKQVSK